jgi:endothelin-converting enzyme/putative endopeptidase
MEKVMKSTILALAVAALVAGPAVAQVPTGTMGPLRPDQKQFFIAWGQWRGDETRPETQRTMIQGDPHPVAKYRVNGPLSNLHEFRDAFQCKAGDPMVRPDADRCEVW